MISPPQKNGSTEPLSIRLFGALEVQQQGVTLPRTRTRKEQWLLALLVLSHGQALGRPWLASLLWPDTPEEGALGHLRRSLSELRRVLGRDAARLSTPTPRSMRLDLVGARVDVFDFDVAVKGGDAASLEQAISLYRGPLLQGCQEEWVLPERLAREQAYLQALETLAEQAQAQKEPTLCAGYLRRILAVDPLRESVWQLLMQALAAAGDYAASNQAYRDLRLLLHEQMNLAPSPATAALFQQIRTEAQNQAQEVKPLHRAAAPVLLSRIPRPVSSLVGREKEIEEVAVSLATARLVTLTGTGGVGKTRLATAVATASAENYADGIWFIDLAPLSDAALIPRAVASVLGMREEPAPSLIEALCTHLQSKSLLLVLDNCEHLLSACGHLVEALLQAAPNLRLLTTSRENLGITGEVSYRVPCLSLPDATHVPTIESLGQYEAIRLFVERARSRQAAFTLSERNSGQVLHICRSLDGIPLAIELAAAWVRALSVAEIDARLKDRFSLLTGGNRTGMPRQQTLLATLDWSCSLLTEKEKSVLLRLSVFAGGWGLEAAETVCGSDPVEQGKVLDLLVRLVDKSLVVYEQPDGVGRYRLLETMRQYTRIRLQESEGAEPARKRHLDFFLQLAEEIEPQFIGPEQIHLLARLEAEHDNLRTALDYCKEAENGEIGLRLATALWRFWHTHGHAPEGRRRLEEALASRGAAAPTELRAKALNGLAGIVLFLGDYAAAQTLLAESLAIRRKLGNGLGVTIALNNLGTIAQQLGDFKAARSLHEEALAIYRDREDAKMVAATLVNAGYAAFSQNDYQAARAYNEECLVLSRQLGDRQSVALALDNLGDIARVSGEYVLAHSHHAEALTIVLELGDQRLAAQCLEGLGRVAAEQGNPKRALRLFAFENGLRHALSTPQSATEQQQQDGYIAVARSVLSTESFEQAWSEGAAMSLEQAIQYTLYESA
jgi:predicted ATPase/DNA-binding SARP family transcriptional activator